MTQEPSPEETEEDLLASLPAVLKGPVDEIRKPVPIFLVAIRLADLTGDIDEALKGIIGDYRGAELLATHTGANILDVLECLEDEDSQSEDEYVFLIVKEIFVAVRDEHKMDIDSEVSWGDFVKKAENNDTVKRILAKNPSFAAKAFDIIANAFAQTKVMGKSMEEPDVQQARTIKNYTRIFSISAKAISRETKNEN